MQKSECLKVSAAKKKSPLCEIIAEYTVRITRGEGWNEIKCLRCELDKLSEARDYEIVEVLHAKDTLWICVKKMCKRAEFLLKKNILKVQNKFALKLVHKDMNKMVEELK